MANYIFLVIIFSLFFSHIPAIGYSNEVGITDGMYVKHTTSMSYWSEVYPSTVTFSKTLDEIFHVTRENGAPCTGNCICFWDVTINTRIVSNADNPAPLDGSHDFFWIYTDVSLNDQIPIFNTPNGSDTIFTITDETNYRSMVVWQLEDEHGSVVLYEKTKGFLVNGTFRSQTDWQKFEFDSTNALGKAGIPGYNYFFLIGLLLVSTIVILKKKSIRE